MFSLFQLYDFRNSPSAFPSLAYATDAGALIKLGEKTQSCWKPTYDGIIFEIIINEEEEPAGGTKGFASE